MHHCRQALLRMCQGDSDRDIAVAWLEVKLDLKQQNESKANKNIATAAKTEALHKTEKNQITGG